MIRIVEVIAVVGLVVAWLVREFRNAPTITEPWYPTAGSNVRPFPVRRPYDWQTDGER